MYATQVLRVTRCFLFVYFVAVLSSLALASPPIALSQQRTECDIDALVNERDPAGLNVRAAPNSKSRVLGKLAPVIDDKKTRTLARVEVSVIASQDGWFLIEGAGDNDALTEGRPKRKMYGGKGWVSGKKLTLKSQAEVVRNQPDVKAKVLFRDTSLFSDPSVAGAHLISCDRHWAFIEYDLGYRKGDRDPPASDIEARIDGSPYRLRGWVNQICGIQETMCDGLKDE